MKKYELTDEIREIVRNDILYELHRIQALVDIENICSAGDLGGWIETEDNLSHEDRCWVYGNAMVFEEAKVCDDALIHGNAVIYGKAQIMDSAQIFENAKIGGNTCVWGNARIYGNAKIRGNAMVFEEAIILGNSYIYENAAVCGNAMICDDSYIHGNCRIHGDTTICGEADITQPGDYLTIGSIGSGDDTVTFYRGRGIGDGILVTCTYGGFSGNIDEFEKVVKNTLRMHSYCKAYKIAIKLAKEQLRGK